MGPAYASPSRAKRVIEHRSRVVSGPAATDTTFDDGRERAAKRRRTSAHVAAASIDGQAPGSRSPTLKPTLYTDGVSKDNTRPLGSANDIIASHPASDAGKTSDMQPDKRTSVDGLHLEPGPIGHRIEKRAREHFLGGSPVDTRRQKCTSLDERDAEPSPAPRSRATTPTPSRGRPPAGMRYEPTQLLLTMVMDTSPVEVPCPDVSACEERDASHQTNANAPPPSLPRIDGAVQSNGTDVLALHHRLRAAAGDMPASTWINLLREAATAARAAPAQLVLDSPRAADTIDSELLATIGTCVSNMYPSVRTAAADALAAVYDADHAHLERIIHLTVQLLMTATKETRKLIRRCKATACRLLSAEPARTQLALTTTVNLVLNDNIGSEIVSILKSWSQTRTPSAASIDPDVWRNILKSLDKVPSTPMPTTNYESWEYAPPDVTARDQRIAAKTALKVISQNLNSIRPRWRAGLLQLLLRNEDPDIAYFSEVRSDTRHLDDATELKATLYSMGYRYCHWFWCTDNVKGYGYSGCLLISKLKPDSVVFGTTPEGVATIEGRVITARYTAADFTLIGAYSPCSAMGTDATPRRVAFDEDLTQHIAAERSICPNVITCGDINVAPLDHDATLSFGFEATTHSSCKAHERETYAAWISSGMRDMYRFYNPTASPSDYTWHRSERHQRQGIGMRVDHVLATDSMAPGVLDGHTGPSVTSCTRLTSKYGSDHYGLAFYINRRELHRQAHNVKAPPPEPAPFCSATCEQDCTCPDVPGDGHSEASFAKVCSVVRTAIESQDEYRVDEDALGFGIHRKTAWFPKIVRTPANIRQPPPTPDLTPMSAASASQPAADDQHLTSADASPSQLAETRFSLPASNGVDKATTSTTAAAATTADSILSDGEMLRRYLRLSTLVNTMPEIYVPCGARHCTGTILLDSGARANLITAKYAADCGARWLRSSTVTKHTPSFILADGSLTKPIGLVVLDMHIPDDSPVRVLAWVMPEGPCDLIFGSESMRENGCILDYDTLQVCFRRQYAGIAGTPTVSYINFTSKAAIRSEAAAALYASSATVVPPGHHGLVPVNASRRTHVSEGTWGLVSNTGLRDVHFLVAKGFLTLHRDDNWVQVMNVTDRSIVIKRGQRVAYFHRQDKAAITIQDCDLDAINREAVESSRALSAMAAVPLTEADREETDSAYAARAHLADITIGDAKGDNITKDELCIIKRKILQYHELWDKSANKNPKAHGVQCDIQLTAPPKMHARHRNVNPLARQQIAKVIKEQRDAGIIQDSCSPYSSTVLLVPKPGGGVRFCVDFRSLNKIIKRDAYPLPRVEDSLAALHGSRYFSAVDIVTAFWQVPLAPASRELTAFATPDGLFEYLRMPMGLATASGVFSKFIDEVFRGLKWHCILTYIDDVLIYTSTFEQHVATLDTVFTRLSEHGLTLGAKKCNFCTSSTKFLGHVVSVDGIHPDPDKISAIQRLSIDEIADKKGLRAMMGIFGYYRKFCKAYSTVAQPLTSCLKDAYKLPRTANANSIAWTAEQRVAFHELKRMLTDEAMLAHPDWTQPFTIDTDACGHGLGAVLSQMVDGKEQVVAYASRSLADNEKKYTIWELETLAVVWAIDLFGWYLWNLPFTVRTDANAVEWVLQKATTGRLMRWALNLQEREFTIKHRKGSANGNADALSRCPLRSSCPYKEHPIEPIHGVAPPLHASAAYFGTSDAEAWDGPALARLQLADPWCKPCMARIRKLREDNDLQPSSSAPPNADLERFSLHEDGSLWLTQTHRTHSVGKPLRTEVVVVPDSLKAFILRRHHGLPMSGHAGSSKTLRKLRERYWWKHMARDVKRWVSACLVCRKRKTPRPLHAGTPQSVCLSPHPFHTVAIDLVGPASEATSGNKYILTMLDTFTRWVVAVPIPSKRTDVVAHAIYRHWICKYGCMSRVLSDQGREFVNKGILSMCTRWSIRQIKTTGWQPQANPVERVHRWLNSSMTTISKNFEDDWDLYVDAIVFAFNTSYHEATGYSPYNLVFGRQPRLPDDVIFGHAQRDYADETALRIHCSEWLAGAYKHAITKQTAMAAKNRACRDRRFRRAHFAPDDYVLYWQPNSAQEQPRKASKDSSGTTKSKWTSQWTGPHRIIRCSGSNHYFIQHGSKATELKVHVNRLCVFNAWSDELPSTSPDLDTDQPWRCGNDVAIGDLFIINYAEGRCPFGVGRLSGRTPAGELQFVWLSNGSDNPKGTFQPGWLTTDGRTYYSDKRRHRNHEPYTGLSSGTIVKDADVALHGFDLTDHLRIPVPVLRAISTSKM